MWDRLNPSQFSELLDTSPDAVLLLDASGTPQAANAALLALIGGDIQTLDSAHPLQLLRSDATTVSYYRPDGSRLELEIRRSALADGSHVAWFRDISERRRLERELAEQSLTDPVTGLLNTRGLIVALEPQVSRSRRYDSPLSLVMLELQGAAVDQDLLKRVSRVLKDQMRWADMIGCNAHHQFILALPETRQDDAMKLVEKLRIRLHQGEDGFNTAFGVAEWRKADNAHTLLERAATALHPAATAAAVAGH